MYPFLKIPHISSIIWYSSFSVWLHSVWQSLGLSMLLQMALSCSFLWLSNIPLYICTTSFCVCEFVYFVALLGYNLYAKNYRHLKYTSWWVWTYVFTRDAIKAIDTSTTLKNFHFFFFSFLFILLHELYPPNVFFSSSFFEK